LAERLRARHSSGHDYSIVVVAEGTPDPQGEEETSGVDAYGFARLGGVGNVTAHERAPRSGDECRGPTLGSLQRGGPPTAYDRILATRLGIAAGELALEGRTGVMVAVRGDRIEPVPLDVVSAPPRALDLERYQEAAWFFA